MLRVDFAKLRFLVVDDNEHMRSLLRTVLHGFGSRDVIEADDGVTGLEAFIAHRPDIVLTDWAMPRIDGIEMTRRLRDEAAGPNPYVPIIMVSAHSARERVIAAREAGVTEFLVKPISPKSLFQRIVNVVANPRPFIRTSEFFGPCRRRGHDPHADTERRRAGPPPLDIEQSAALHPARLAGQGSPT